MKHLQRKPHEEELHSRVPVKEINALAVANNKIQASALWLLLRSVWRTSNVIWNRFLGHPPRYLPVLLLFVTERCNLRCRSCGVCDSALLHEKKDPLSTEQWKAVITSAATKLGTSLVSISGGEPLLRTDIYEIIRYASDAGMSVHICTNGVLLDRDRANHLRDSGVSTVSISLESPDQETHDYLRGKNTFPSVLDSIALLKKTAPNIRIGVNYLITRRNYHNMTEMVGFAESLGVHQLKFAPIHTNLLHRHKTEEQFDDLLFREEDLDDLEREVLRAQAACAASSLLTTSDAFFSGIVALYRTPKKIRCYAGYAVCAVNASGDVSPCCDMDGEFNVKDKPLDVIWRTPAFHQLRKKVHHCDAACWDTTNTELSLRLQPWALVSDLSRNWRDLLFYFGKRHD